MSGAKITKMRCSKPIRFLCYISSAIPVLGFQVPAQPVPPPDDQPYAGLSITGSVGAVYAVECVTDPAQTNANDWRCLTFLQLPATHYRWFDPAFPATGRRWYRAVAFAPPTNMVLIPPGTFRLGSPTNEAGRDAGEGPQKPVTIGGAFWMAKFLVTQGDYRAVMGGNPSAFTGDLSRPVEGVSWNDATNYCGRLTRRERGAGRIATSIGYRLPTELEWEYACRAGTSTRFSYGDDPGYAHLADYAWYKSNSGGTTHPVGQKLPNPWGLYDMHGNVFEWCQDLYDSNPGGTAREPRRTPRGPLRVFRGGLWDGGGSYCQSAFRGHSVPGSRSPCIGFRVVLAPGP